MYDPRPDDCEANGVLFFRFSKDGYDDAVWRVVTPGDLSEQDKKDVLKAVYCYHVGDDLYRQPYDLAARFVVPVAPTRFHECHSAGLGGGPFRNDDRQYWQIGI